MDKKRAFTLIELLVVIAVIGLLGSLILVAVDRAKEQAEISRGFQFSATIKHSLGSFLAGEWNFSEGSGNIVKDSSGNKSDMTWSGVGSYWSDSGIKELGMAGVLNGADDYLRYSNSSGPGGLCSGPPFTDGIPLCVKDKFTIEAFINPQQKTGTEAIFGNVNDVFSRHLIFFLEDSKLGLYLEGISGSDECLLYSLDNSILYDKWQHVAVSFGKNAGSGNVRFYVNGKENARGTCNIDFEVYCVSFKIGKGDTFSNDWYKGYIDQVRVYKESIFSIKN